MNKLTATVNRHFVRLVIKSNPRAFRAAIVLHQLDPNHQLAAFLMKYAPRDQYGKLI